MITPFFPSKKSFVGSYVFDQVNEINKQTKYNISIIKIVSLFSREKDYFYKDYKVCIFKIIDFPFFFFPGIFNKINNIRFKYFLKRKNIENISVSHAHVSYPASYLQNILSCTKIIQHHGLDVLQLLNGRVNFLRRIYKDYLIKNTINVLNKADLNIGVSQKVLDQLHQFVNYQPKNEIVLYNGVDRTKFYPLKKMNDIFTIGCIANFWKIKDHMTTIKSIRRLIDTGVKIKLRLIGTGKTLNSCKKYVNDNNLSEFILFEKELEHHKLNKFYNEIDLFVLPSYYEALGCVYLESWATNTPFIAVKNQGVSEIIPEDLKNLMLVSESCPLDLSKKINFFIENKVNIEFDSKFDIRHTISDFLKNNIFND